MSEIFEYFRFFGVLPYCFEKKQPLFSREWLRYSRIFALIIIALAFYRTLMCEQYPVDMESTILIYQFLLKYEPVFIFVNICIIYYQIFVVKDVNRILKVIKLLLRMTLNRNYDYKKEKKIMFATFGASIILLILIFVVCLNIEQYPMLAQIHLLDYLAMYAFTVVVTVQALQFCVYFQMIIGALNHVQYEISFEKRNERKLLDKLLELSKITSLIKKMQRIYYPNMITLQLSVLFYSVTGCRGLYEFFYGSYMFELYVILTWTIFDIPLQLYFMHLNEVMIKKVNDYLINENGDDWYFSFQMYFRANNYEN